MLIAHNRIENLWNPGGQSDAINLQGGTNYRIVNNYIENAWEGVDIFGSESLIQHNVFHNISFWPLKVIHGASGNVIRDNLTTGNQSSHPGGPSDIAVAGSSVVYRNTFGNFITANRFLVHTDLGFHVTANGGTIAESACDIQGGIPTWNFAFNNELQNHSIDLRSFENTKDNRFFNNFLVGLEITGSVNTTIDDSLVDFTDCDINGDGKRDFLSLLPDGRNIQYVQVDGPQCNKNSTFTKNANLLEPDIALLAGFNFLRTGHFGSGAYSDFLFFKEATGENRVYYGRGDGAFNRESGALDTAGFPLPSSEPLSTLLATDFDGDTTTDLFFHWKISGAHVLFLKRSGGWEKTVDPIGRAAINGSPDYVLTGDFNGDGLSDLLFYWFSGQNRFYFKKGAQGTEWTAYDANPISPTAINGESSTRIYVDDFNQDGRDDVLAFFESENYKRIFYSLGDGTFPEMEQFATN